MALIYAALYCVIFMATIHAALGETIDPDSLFVGCPSDYVPRTRQVHFALNGTGVPYKTCDVTMDVQPGNMAAESIWHSSTIEVVYEEVICQDQGSISPSCGGGKVLNIIDANYGRTKSGAYVCPTTGVNDDTSNCINAASLSGIQLACDLQSSCSWLANDIPAGDVCPDIHKYLNITYKCVDP